MSKVSQKNRIDVLVVIATVFLTLISVFTLNSIYPSIFPSYYINIAVSVIIFVLVTKIDFDILSLFSKHFYVISVAVLLITLVIGQLNRGTVRWLGIGSASIQPSEILRPFLVLFAANFIYSKKDNFKSFVKVLILLFVPVLLIFLQPSLGVSIVLSFGFLGVILLSQFSKKYLLVIICLMIIVAPFSWFIIQPYQKSRIMSFIDKSPDRLGANYNSIQSMITVGSGGVLGRGLGKGVQTQLAFLPEKQTDFIFASVSEELGFVGSSFTLVFLFVIVFRLLTYIDGSKSPVYRMYTTGVIFMFFIEIVIHVGMNMGLLPITGIPLPFVSAGGSSFLTNSILLGICMSGRGAQV